MRYILLLDCTSDTLSECCYVDCALTGSIYKEVLMVICLINVNLDFS